MEETSVGEQNTPTAMSTQLDSEEAERCIKNSEGMWNVTYEPVINVFCQDKSIITNEQIHNLLQAFLRSDLNNILVPAAGNSSLFEEHLKRHSAFLTWLFGVLFALTGTSEDELVLEYSIDIQAKMLKLLMTYDLKIYSFIMAEYIGIIEELVTFRKFYVGSEKPELSKFRSNIDVIGSMELKNLPTKIRCLDSTLESILKIMIKTRVYKWNCEFPLWNNIIDVLSISSQKTKIVSFDVIFELLDFDLKSDTELERMFKCVTEMTNLMPVWNQQGALSKDLLKECPRIFSKLLKISCLSKPSVQKTSLCLALVNLMAEKIIGNELKQEIYDLIYNFQKHNYIFPMLSDYHCITLSENLPDFNSILMNDVLTDVKNNATPGEIVKVAKISKLWMNLRAKFMENLEKKNFAYIHGFLVSTNLLYHWIIENKIEAQLFEDDMNVIYNFLISNLDDNNSTINSLVFQCIICLMNHSEVDKGRILHFLSTRWNNRDDDAMDVDFNDYRNIGRTIDFQTKLECLEVICRYESGKNGLRILKDCITKSDIPFSIAAIPNCLLLSKNNNIRVEDILKLMFSTISCNSPELHEIVAKTLGELICLLSKHAMLIRESWNKSNLIVKCDVCDKPEQGNDSRIYNLSSKCETIITSFFNILMPSIHEKIRLQMSNNFLRFSNHIKEFNTNKTANLWLTYINDKNPNVRRNIGRVIGYLVQNNIAQLQQTHVLSDDNVPIELERFVDSVINILHISLKEAINKKDSLLLKDLLNTATKFACVELYLTEKRILSLIVYMILHPNTSTKEIALANAAFEQVAEFHHLSPMKMYVRYRKHFLNIIVQMSVSNLLNYNFDFVTSLYRISHAIGYEGPTQLLNKEQHFIVAFLIPHIVETPKAITLLENIAEKNFLEKEELLKNYFPYICIHFLLDVEQEIGVKCLMFVLKTTNSTIQTLMNRFNFMAIFDQLFLRFDENAIDYLKLIFKWKGESVRFDTKKEITEYLKPYLHGVLVTAEINLRQIVDEESQKCAIASLVALIHFMGPEYITPLRYKFLSTLRMLLKFIRPGFRKLTFEAWDAFIRNTLIHDLGTLLPEIFSSVVPLLETYPKETNEMLEYLVIKNEGALSPYIPELFFIEDINVSRNILNVVTTCIKRRRSECIKENLGLWIKRIDHEIDSVKLRALVHLKPFLAENRSKLNGLILANANVHALILELLDMLIAGCRDKDEAIQLAYGECLGELGAIDPSLLPKRIVSREDSKFITDVKEEFACAALVEFAKGFQMQTNSHDADCFCLAIQEILKVYKISPNSTNSIFWESMPYTVREMINPFLTSHYIMDFFENQIVYPLPIYGTDMSITFEKWAFNWMMSMFVKLPDSKLKSILKSSSPALKRDVRIVEFFIPHIATFIIRNGRENEWREIAQEMLAVITENAKSVDTLLNTRPLYNGTTESKNTRVSDEAKHVRCSQVVFSTLDYLQRWLREMRVDLNDNYKSIKEFCEMFDGFVLAEGSYKTYEFHRALLYLEQHMAISKKGLTDSKERDLFVKIYLQLEEPDGVAGILASQSELPSAEQLVLSHKISGQFQDAAICYEKMAQRRNKEPRYWKGMIQSYLSLGQPLTAMCVTKRFLEERPELESIMSDYECVWRLALFGNVDSKENVKHNYLQDLKNCVKPDLTSVKKKILSSLASSSHPGAYEHSYSSIMKLHIINEFEKAIEKILVNVDAVPSIFEEWEKRFQLVKASSGVEFLLSMRRATLDLAFLYQRETTNVENTVLMEEIGKIWIKSAKIARKAGLYQQAYMYILSAEEILKPQEICTEMAQLFWQKGSQEYAFATLKRCLDNYFPPAEVFKSAPVNENMSEKKQYAKAKLLFAKYNHETQNVQTRTNIGNFKEAIEVWRCWENSYIACAQYYESLVNKMSEDAKDVDGRDMQIQSLLFYAKSLKFGCKHIHQSMPRMLTIWLEFASRTQKRIKNKTASEYQKEGLKRLTSILESYLDVLPTFTWLTAFSQLVSRIYHPSLDVQRTLKMIIVKLILAHPQHCLWMIASISQSENKQRKTQCSDILNHEKICNSEVMKIVKDFRKLWTFIIELSDKPVPENQSKTTVSALSSKLPALFNSPGFSRIMMPTSELRKLHLPLRGESFKDHEPFLRNWVSIDGINESINVMQSLVRPKQISLRGSDGKNYLFMCKPKDDLRKDFRLMEFNDIVNKYLQKDPMCRQRRLYIRTYSVAPLNEQCGLIEWIPNLVGLRKIIVDLYKRKGIYVSNAKLRTLICGNKASLIEKRKCFTENLIPHHPPVLSEWFRLTFPDPYGWYEARTAYIRTTAVMSMVGYILGLGDRHGENISFDSKCGDCVHVDFNCLFNYGERFDIPERVPFRLTHNMTDAMGALKYEGPFRRSCEITMRVLREQRTTLQSVLTPFVYDPLVNESSRERKERKAAGIKVEDEETNYLVLRINDILHRLNGQVRSVERSENERQNENNVYLSVEGQVSLLILQATNIDNLCQMYQGWGAFL